jgi:hypothetical protein
MLKVEINQPEWGGKILTQRRKGAKAQPNDMDCGGKRHAALVRTKVLIGSFTSRAGESDVAAALPPQSKILA